MSSLRISPTGDRHFQSGFWLWGWTMLLVVLLSAAPTGGQLHVRAVGSAFDPAASAVTVNPKRLKLDSVAGKVERKDGDAPSAGGVPSQLPAAPLEHRLRASAVSVSRIVFTPIYHVPAPTALLALQYPARAPPLA